MILLRYLLRCNSHLSSTVSMIISLQMPYSVLPKKLQLTILSLEFVLLGGLKRGWPVQYLLYFSNHAWDYQIFHNDSSYSTLVTLVNMVTYVCYVSNQHKSVASKKMHNLFSTLHALKKRNLRNMHFTEVENIKEMRNTTSECSTI